MRVSRAPRRSSSQASSLRVIRGRWSQKYRAGLVVVSRLIHPSGVDNGPPGDGRGQQEGCWRRRWVGGLSAMRHEAAGLLELHGARALYTFPFLFFSFRSRSAIGRTFTVLVHSRLLYLSPLGSAFRSCDGAGAAVAATRGVPCNARRLPWPVGASPQSDDFPKRLFPGGMMDR